MNSFHRCSLLLIPSLIAGLVPATAQVYQVTVNVSNPAAVVIAATGQNATANDSSNTDSAGISLLIFFLSPGLNLFTATSSSLQAPGGRTYTGLNGDDTSPLTRNLRVFEPGIPAQSQNFSTASAAFQGSLVVNLSSIAGRLPAAGATGSIISGSIAEPGPTIGQWIAVPEPETYGMAFGAGLIGFAMWRRSRK
jgi:hypothetical protein